MSLIGCKLEVDKSTVRLAIYRITLLQSKDFNVRDENDLYVWV